MCTSGLAASRVGEMMVGEAFVCLDSSSLTVGLFLLNEQVYGKKVALLMMKMQ
jgi:hypothetical protein